MLSHTQGETMGIFMDGRPVTPADKDIRDWAARQLVRLTELRRRPCQRCASGRHDRCEDAGWQIAFVHHRKLEDVECECACWSKRLLKELTEEAA